MIKTATQEDLKRVAKGLYSEISEPINVRFDGFSEEMVEMAEAHAALSHRVSGLSGTLDRQTAGICYRLTQVELAAGKEQEARLILENQCIGLAQSIVSLRAEIAALRTHVGQQVNKVLAALARVENGQ